MGLSFRVGGLVVAVLSGVVVGQQSPSEDPERVVGEASRTPEKPVSFFDRPIYRAVQEVKQDLNEKYGFNFAVEDTLIYQAASGGVDPGNAAVNTLGLFATWKVFRSDNGKDFAGPAFQFETRGDPFGDHMTDLRDSLGTIWSPNDSTSDDYSKINQLWWGQRMLEGKIGFQAGKIDPGSIINQNRFAGSGNTQFFGQPLATNPARSFSDNGLGLQVRADPVNWMYVHFLMADGDAVSTHSPFTTINGHWLYAGEVGWKPVIKGLGQGVYRLMVYERDRDDADEFGWALSFDQNVTEEYGVFMRFGSNDGGINSVGRIASVGLSALEPFGRKDDQAGVGVSYTHPKDDDPRDEYAAEVYYRMQVSEGFQLSADAQLIIDPSGREDQDVEAVFGLRARVLY